MPVADLAEAFALTETGPNTYRAANFELGERGVVFGGQLIGQLLVAGATIDPTKRVKSAQAIFARPVLVADDVELRVDVLQRGRTFASGSVSLWQDDKERARAMLLLTAEEPDMIRHGSAMPDVSGPDAATPMRPDNDDFRVVDGVDILDAEIVGDPSVDVWFRRTGAPVDHAVGQGLLAHNSATMLIGAAMRPHAGVGQSAAHASFSTGIISHTISFHEPIDIAEWHLLANRSDYAGRGRVYGTGQVFSESGQLLASYSQEAMVRYFPEGVSPEGQESTVL